MFAILAASVLLAQELGDIPKTKTIRPNPELAALGARFIEDSRSGEPRVVAIFTSLVGVHDEHLVQLKTIPQLHTVLLNRTSITDAGMAQLSGIESLRVLDVNGTKIGKAGLDKIVALKDLTHLGLLQFPNIDDEAMERVAKFSHLRSLTLSAGKPGLTDAGFDRLAELTELEDLWIDGETITDDTLTHLAKIPNLKSVTIGHGRTTPAGVARLEASRKGLHVNVRDQPDKD